jgi:hypothetical protein
MKKSEIKEIKIRYTVLYCVNFCGSIYCGSGTVINYDSGSVPPRQKVSYGSYSSGSVSATLRTGTLLLLTPRTLEF